MSQKQPAVHPGFMGAHGLRIPVPKTTEGTYLLLVVEATFTDENEGRISYDIPTIVGSNSLPVSTAMTITGGYIEGLPDGMTLDLYAQHAYGSPDLISTWTAGQAPTWHGPVSVIPGDVLLVSLQYQPAAPDLADIERALVRHPQLLWDLVERFHKSPPKVAGPWISGMPVGLSFRRDKINGQAAVTVNKVESRPARQWGVNIGPRLDNLGHFDDLHTAQEAADNWLKEAGWALL